MSANLSKTIKNTVTAMIFIAVTVILASCSSSVDSTSIKPTVNSNGILVGAKVYNQTLTIETGKMDKKPGWPRYVPANFSLPENSIIKLTIINHDDGTAPLPPSSPWSKVWGSDPTYGLVTGGYETVNGKKVTSINPNDVSHTFTIPGLLINVPIPAAVSESQPAVVVFEFSVGTKGVFHWICAAPCGSGSTGMGGAMNTSVWMEGNVEVK